MDYIREFITMFARLSILLVIYFVIVELVAGLLWWVGIIN